MTPNEYRKKHKRCATCMYYEHLISSCKVKLKTVYGTDGKFCKVYKPKEYEE